MYSVLSLKVLIIVYMLSFISRLTVYAILIHSFSYVSPAARLRNGMERGKE